ncbi:gnt1 [Symbiodinium natans]|uniref:Gnt1 protein n=1 Tax=Symbiodinium natans TaxID=878477 RepID=A0A812I5G6_9DINO|nr:gnt1 [Symbiodinium natans]
MAARGRRAPWIALVTFVGCATWAPWAFQGSAAGQATRSQSPILLRATGFGAPDRPASRQRKKVDVAQLEADHGGKAAVVEEILKGGTAQNPEDMVRARYSACRLKDAVFMAKTEKDPMKKKLSNRVRAWALCFGTEKPDDLDAAVGEPSKLRRLERLEIIEASGNEVEFKLHCKDGVLHERSIMEEDEKYGWIYSGESKMDEWK